MSDMTPDATTHDDVNFVSERRVACDGGGGALGHPKVYYSLDGDKVVECAYCGRRFAYRPKDG